VEERVLSDPGTAPEERTAAIGVVADDASRATDNALAMFVDGLKSSLSKGGGLLKVSTHAAT
jgi:hypothetical protein